MGPVLNGCATGVSSTGAHSVSDSVSSLQATVASSRAPVMAYDRVCTGHSSKCLTSLPRSVSV